jgi:hypothetical protein
MQTLLACGVHLPRVSTTILSRTRARNPGHFAPVGWRAVGRTVDRQELETAFYDKVTLLEQQFG